MGRLRLKLWVELAVALGGAMVLTSCGGGSREPPEPQGVPQIHSDASVVQSYPVEAPVLVTMSQTQAKQVKISAGQTLTMVVDASGSTTLVYTWRFQGRIIDGAEGPQLKIANVQAANEGFYTVQVSNSYGVAISQGVTVALHKP